MIGIIVTGHGHFGTGLTSSMKVIAGESESLIAVDFLENDSTEILTNKLNEAIETLALNEIIVFSDLPGGSPFKTSVEIKMTRPDLKIEVIGGSNLPMLIEISMARGFIENIDDLVSMALNTGKDQIVQYVFKTHQEEISEDGI